MRETPECHTASRAMHRWVVLASLGLAVAAAAREGPDASLAMERRIRELEQRVRDLTDDRDRLARTTTSVTSSSSARRPSGARPASPSGVDRTPASPPTSSRASFPLYTARRVAFERGPDALNSPERLYYLPDFLSPAEASHLIRLGEPRLEPSRLINPAAHAGQEAQRRRSSLTAAFPNEDESLVLQAVLHRMHTEAGIPRRNGEALQLTKYPIGSNYSFHFDSSLRVGRLATFLVFLNDVEEGGETIFPHATLTRRGREKLQLIREGRARELAAADGEPSLVAQGARTAAQKGQPASIALWEDDDEEDEEDEDVEDGLESGHATKSLPSEDRAVGVQGPEAEGMVLGVSVKSEDLSFSERREVVAQMRGFLGADMRAFCSNDDALKFKVRGFRRVSGLVLSRPVSHLSLAPFWSRSGF